MVYFGCCRKVEGVSNLSNLGFNLKWSKVFGAYLLIKPLLDRALSIVAVLAKPNPPPGMFCQFCEHQQAVSSCVELEEGGTGVNESWPPFFAVFSLPKHSWSPLVNMVDAREVAN